MCGHSRVISHDCVCVCANPCVPLFCFVSFSFLFFKHCSFFFDQQGPAVWRTLAVRGGIASAACKWGTRAWAHGTSTHKRRNWHTIRHVCSTWRVYLTPLSTVISCLDGPYMLFFFNLYVCHLHISASTILFFSILSQPFCLIDRY